MALDGSPCTAVNATERHVPQDQRTTLLQQIDQRVEGDLKARDGQETHEEAGTPGGAVAAHGPAKSEARQPRTLLSPGWQAQCEARGATQRSRTDPASRAMQRGKGRGTAVCSNVPMAVDRKPKRMIAHAVTHEPGARAWLRPMALQAQDSLGSPCAAVADVGSDHGEAVTTWLAAGRTPSGARPLTAATQKLGLCSTEDGAAAETTETSQCPAGERRTWRCDAVELGGPAALRRRQPAAAVRSSRRAHAVKGGGG